MGIIASDKGGGGNRILPPEGTHTARCFSIVHTGTRTDENYKTSKNIVRITFELPEERAVFKEGDNEKPFVISKKYNLSLNEKATLRKDLESWRGKEFTPEESKGFDITKLLGLPCMVSVVHKTADNGNVYANVTSVTKPPKSVTVPEAENKTFLFSVDNFDQEAFDNFPDFIKDEIMESNEYKNLDAPLIEEEQANDLPF